MQIFVDLCDSGTFAVRVQPRQTFGHLKSMLFPSHDAAQHGPSNEFYFCYGGKALHDSCVIMHHGIRDCSTLQLRVRARGGGGDGGATGAESRDCYLNMYAVKKPDKVDPNEERLAKWSRCALSSEALRPPCVVDMLGNLYNKEAVVSALLTKSLPKELRYIKGLKDMVTIHLTPIPGVSPDEDTSSIKFQCPISGQELNGKYKFYALRSCGHVLSTKALKELQSLTCLVCYTPFEDTDKIIVNGTEDEVLVLRQRMEEKEAKLREKKGKKLRNGLSQESGVFVAYDAQDKGKGDGEAEKLWPKTEVKVTSSVQEVVVANGIKRKGDRQEKILATGKDQRLVQPSKRFKAVENLPQNATKEVYASIFSSSSKSNFKETYSCRSLPLGRN